MEVKTRAKIKPAESRAALRVCSREGFPTNPSRARGSKVNRTAKCLSERERENFSHALFCFRIFLPANKIENCSAQFLAVCWIVRVEFKVHRLRLAARERIATTGAECAGLSEVLPRRREHLDLLRRFDDLDAVLHVGRDGIRVAGPQFVLRVPRENTDTPRQKVAALLVRVRMEWDEVVFTVAHLGDH